MVVVKRALLSCSDKTGLAEFAGGLAKLDVRLIASGGTASSLHRHGLSAQSVESFTGTGEQLDGRVKTLHPRIYAGILARRDDPRHVAAAGDDGLIDLVVVNLYPFEETIRRDGVSLADVIEQIDIGGVSLLRAAAKNFQGVAVVSHPDQYTRVLDVLRREHGRLPEDVSRELAVAAFRLTSRYDELIGEYLGQSMHTDERMPAHLTLRAHLQQSLRYGENPHQQAGWYVPADRPVAGLARLHQRQGKELSYNNLLDLDAAVRCVGEFTEPACVIVKHAAPCGVACAPSSAEAYRLAFDGDQESAFGGIVALNRPLDRATAEAMRSLFLEVVAAPAIEPDALATLARKTNLRVLECPTWQPPADALAWRTVAGGWLVQDEDRGGLAATELQVPTKRAPTDDELRDLRFAWQVVKHIKSNAAVLAANRATVGIGQGQPSRVRAVRLAISNAGERANGAVLASDGFFPFPDSVNLAAQGGIRAIIQPGGSVKDSDVIAAADRAGIAMVLTGVRHFRH